MLVEEETAVLEIKFRGIQYLRDNPERFNPVESDVETSWLEYVIQYVYERNMGSSYWYASSGWCNEFKDSHHRIQLKSFQRWPQLNHQIW